MLNLNWHSPNVQLIADARLGNLYRKDSIRWEDFHLNPLSLKAVDSLVIDTTLNILTKENTSSHCFHKTQKTPKWLCGAKSLHWQRGESWIGGESILGWTSVCWRLLIKWTECVVEAPGESHQEGSLGAFCWCDITLFPVMWVIPAQEPLAITGVSLMYFRHCRSLIIAFQWQVFCCRTSTDVCIDPVLQWWRS